MNSDASPSHRHDDVPPFPGEAVVHVHRGAGLGITRRQALSLMAASAALASAGCAPPPHPQAHPWVTLPEARGGALPLYYASAFVRDGHAHGVLVGTQQGRPIKIEGNPEHPTSLGATDVFAQASVLELWDPDRSAVVRQRRPGEPTGDAAPASWPAFEAAWRAQLASRRQSPRAATLRLLTGPVTSPTERALIAALLAQEPDARWHVHAPLADAAAADGARLAFGRLVAPVLHLDRARCVLAIAADPFTEGPGAVRQAMDWARARAESLEANATPATLLAAEISPGLFGARADRRIAATPVRLEAMLRRIASHWLPALATAPVSTRGDGDDADAAAFERHAIASLKAAGADALVVGGRGLSADAHAIVLALNQALGAIGRSLHFIAPPDGADDAGTLADLVQALERGEVDTLVVVGANPAYDAPSAPAVRNALRRARMLVHAGLHDDETAALADWHLPLSHDYERWGDALAHDGSATVLQPAILPLYDTRSAIELLALLAGDDLRDGHALVQRQWRARHGQGFDAFWRESVRAGVVAASASPPVTPGPARLPEAAPAAAQIAAPQQAGRPLVALFLPDPSTHDGRYANNGWLQELPRPFTKITWDNAVLLGPRTAAELGLATGDVVQAVGEGGAVDAPVWVSPAQAEGVATVHLGLGRTRAGHVGTGVGFDGNALRATASAIAPITLRATGRRHEFAVTQHETTQHGRELARTVAPGRALAADAPLASLYPPFPSPVHAWAMTIDLDACIGCNACTVACQAENNIPVVGKAQVADGRVMHWIRVDRYDSADARSLFQPVPCMQCEQAPCELVCPVGATVHDSEGINVQIYNRCVGTRFCSNNCPYKVRRFNFLQYADRTSETLKAQRNPDVTVRQHGVMEKCSYCLQRIARARQRSEREGVPIADGDVVTACQAACPTRAIHFGDLRDEGSDIVRAKASPRHYTMLAELGTRPRTTYLARVDTSGDAPA
jgi:molybdopterin-containing oxidoreductase family iron-sulfur binding subunit